MAERRGKGASGGAAKPGEVKHDSRGNAVWKWAVDTGKHALDSTSALLRRLDLPGLSLEDDKPAGKKPDPAELQLEAGKRAGYDPYGRQGRAAPARPAPGRRAAPASETPAKQVAPRPLSPRAPAPAPRRSSWWSRFFSRR